MAMSHAKTIKEPSQNARIHVWVLLSFYRAKPATPRIAKRFLALAHCQGMYVIFHGERNGGMGFIHDSSLTPALGEVFSSLAPLRYKRSASVS